MGMNLGGMIYLQNKGLLTHVKNHFLDIGPQNVYFATKAQITEFVANQGQIVSDEEFEREIERLVYFSTPRAEERTTFFSEISDLTNIEYHSFDVCPGLKTELLDLNFDTLPERHFEYYDVVINFGTTEHIFNQWNSFEVIHDATKVGGVMYHQLPMSAYLDHGYYCYTPLFFRELAAANQYQIVDLFICVAGASDVVALGIDVRDAEEKLGIPNSVQLGPSDGRIPAFNIHAVLKKLQSAPFRVSLEIATAHSPATEAVRARYVAGLSPSVQAAGSVTAENVESRIAALVADRERRIRELTEDREKRISELVTERERIISQLVDEREQARGALAAIRNSLLWKLSWPLRKIARLFRR